MFLSPILFENTVSVMDKEQNKVMKTVEVGEIPSGINVMPKYK
jgi:YVTN family beta-propeller protein